MHILLTGASGYIGGALAGKLIEQGHTVTGLARSAETAARIIAAGLNAHTGDVSQPASIASILTQVDAVIHIAVGLPRGVTEADTAFVDFLIEGLAGTGKTLILTSGLGVYAGMDEPYVDEETPLSPQIPMQALRVQLEHRVLDASAQGIRTLVLRPAHVYGHGRSGILIRTLLETAAELKRGAYIGDGTVPVSLVHIDDLVDAYLAALDHGPSGRIYNLVSETVFMKDIAKAINQAVDAPNDVVSLTIEQAQEMWGPIAALYGSAPIISPMRAIDELEWKAVAPSLMFELTHGSLAAARQ